MLKTKVKLPFSLATITKFYTYRTAYVVGVQINDDENQNLYKKVKSFVEKNGYSMDNRICFSTDYFGDFMWSGNSLIVGSLVPKK